MPQGVPVGCSELKLVAEFGVLTPENALKVKSANKRAFLAGRARCRRD
jgi:hypothetical protein